MFLFCRCPKCRVVQYCSVSCYKIHKKNKTQCIKPKQKLKYNQNDPVSVTGYTVSQKQFELLGMLFSHYFQLFDD